MKLPTEDEVTSENYSELAIEYTRDWKIGDRVKVLYRSLSSSSRDGPAWVSDMDSWVGGSYTITCIHHGGGIQLGDRDDTWWFPFYVLEI